MANSISKSLDLKLDRGFGRKSTEFDDGKSHTTKRRSRPNSTYMEHLQRRLSTNQQRYQSSVISEKKNFTIENPVHLKILFNKTPWVPNITVQSNIGRGQPRSRVLSAQQVFQRKSENLDKSKFFKNPYSTGAFKRMGLRKKDSKENSEEIYEANKKPIVYRTLVGKVSSENTVKRLDTM